MNQIIPEKDLHGILRSVALPGRYTGGEYGSITGSSYHDYRMAMCFPDLYEIGMSNQAVKILYRTFNALEGISCERVFAPDKDFERELKDNHIPLYTLESGIPLHELDLIGFSVGYELSATTILSILDAGKISLFKDERKEDAPLIVAGGPAITNPLPFGAFFDGVFIGEAEEAFSKILLELRDCTVAGGTRSDALSILESSKHIWTYQKYKNNERAVRALWNGFSTEKQLEGIPVSNITTVQDNGIIEIMRGCPNSCRFCHAGYYYRPYRQKEVDDVMREADFLVNRCGYNEITLSSLSSGDYKGLSTLVKALHRRFADKQVSFSLPSLRINTFTLSLLQELSIIRKSGLTFAVETPDPEWQRSINKEVTLERTVEILREAKKLGWKTAKFYFMIGLPVAGGSAGSEEEKIAAFIETVQREAGLRLTVNVGTFIPKPHTPFQWSPQLTVEESYRKMVWLKAKFKRNPHVKLSYHTPFVSFLEGVISRGDERVGTLIYKAYQRGARLDAWSEYFNRELWEQVLSEADWDIEAETCSQKDLDKPLPWDTVDLGVRKKFFEYELKKSQDNQLTEGCTTECSHNCGICNSTILPKENKPAGSDDETPVYSSGKMKRENAPVKYIFKFTKMGKAVYLSHINIMNIFQKSLQRSCIEVEYSKGFNPKPKLEFAHPLSLGISSQCEIGSVSMKSFSGSADDWRVLLNSNLPAGITVVTCKALPPYITGSKKKSLMSLYGGARYILRTVKGSSLMIPEIATACTEFIDAKKETVDKELFELFSLSTQEDEISPYLQILLPNTGTKVSNVLFILKELYGSEVCNREITIERTGLYGRRKNERVLRDYFELF